MPLRVLIVEDETSIVDAFSGLLQGEGYETEAVSHPDDVLPTLKRFRPDVVLLDIGLPARSGIDVAAELAGLDERCDMRVIALSGLAADDPNIRHNQHFDGHLEKPVTMTALLRAIARA